MTQPIDALQMAREAELLFNEHLGTEAAKTIHKQRIETLVSMVLERAAIECEQSEAYRGSMFAQRIRALKPSKEA